MKIPRIPDQFMKLVALMDSTTFPAERDTARRKAEALLTPEMGDFDRALRITAYQRVRAANPMNIMAGFSEFLEIDDPGYMARQAESRSQRLEAWHRRRAELVEQYGSLDAVEAPCEREKAILAAVKPWRIASEPPHQRWTRGFKGWKSPNDLEDMPAPLRVAVEGAISMPATYAEARTELAYWHQRNDDLEHAMGENGVFCGDYGLDFSAETRMHLIRELVDHGMRLTTLPEIVERFALHREQGSDDKKVEAALFRDLCAMVGRDAEPVFVKRAPAASSPGSTAPVIPSVVPTPPPPRWSAEREAEYQAAQKPKRQPSPWPTWTKLSHQERIHWMQEVDAYHELMSRSTKAAFYALHQKLFRRPHEIVTSDEVALFNRTVKTAWQHLQQLEKAA